MLIGVLTLLLSVRVSSLWLGTSSDEGEIADLLLVSRRSSRWCGPSARCEFLFHLIAVRGFERNGSDVFARQRAFDRERDANGFTDDAEGGRIEAENSISGRRVGLPTGTARTGMFFKSQLSRSRDGGLAFVPIAVGGKHDADQVFEFFRRFGQGVV